MTEYGTYVIDFDSKAGNSWKGVVLEEGFQVIERENSESRMGTIMDGWFYVRVMKWNFKNANEEFFAEVLTSTLPKTLK